MADSGHRTRGCEEHSVQARPLQQGVRAGAYRYMVPVGAQPRRERCAEQLQRSRQQGQTQSSVALASSTFSPYRMNRQSPQSWPKSVWQREQDVRLPRVFWRHWWHVTPSTLS